MTYTLIPLEDFLSNAHSPSESELESFSKHRDKLLLTNENESEEHQKIALIEFLAKSFAYECNTKNRIDLSIYEDNKAKVLFEVKSLNNKIEFVSSGGDTLLLQEYSLESKAFYESILYFLREYKTHNNNDIKHIILTNTRDFYLIDAREYLTFAKDKTILKAFDNCDKNQGTDTSTSKFYATLKDYLLSLNSTLKFTHFNIQTTPLPLLYQALSPQVLLKQKTYIDANTLNQSFYDELLYILGLKEIDQKGKILILPTTEQNTLLDSICNKLGLGRDKDFETIFSLLTTWNNRILFLRLLESMLLSFKHITKPFLDIDTLQNFTDLNTLFFDILALKKEKRKTDLKLKDSIPYLNSSLFDKTELEKQNNEISKLDSNHLAIFKHSILKKDKEYKDTQSLPLLEYLFKFLHAYDFTTTPKDIINHTKTNHDKLINAAVLGLVFEKLNGYKEGSFYTPSFITSYMCKESLEKVVIDKFNERKSWECDSLESLAQKLDKLTDSKDGYKEANAIFDSIKVCDPAVGSGHFLVSMLNAMIELKFRLKILCEIHIDDKGERDYKRLKDIRLRLENDEILIQDSNNTLHTYQTPAHENLESHIIQKALFHNKRILIESCLFGVDINPNSCEITKLRLWIELLKYSFYIFDSNGKNTGDLETLPNIDINIKCGNSLTSYMPISEPLHMNIKGKIKEYQRLESDYFNCFYIDKEKHQQQIENIKKDLLQTFFMMKYSKELEELREKCDEYSKHYEKYGIDELPKHYEFLKNNVRFYSMFPRTDEVDKEKAQQALENLKKEHNKIFSLENNFEWRIEFSKLLDTGLTQEQIANNNKNKQKRNFKNLHKNNQGDFLGFDLVIGNPPYIRQEEIKHLKPQLQKAFRIYKGTSDIYTYFYEQGHKILKHNGILSFITSNKYCRAGYGEPLREFLLEATALLYYIELNGIKVFDSASVDTSILSFIKTTPDSKHTFDFAHPKDYDTKANAPLQEYITPQSLLQSSLTKESFIFQDSTNAALKAKIEAIGTPLKEWDISIYRGILTGYNESFIIDSTKRDEILRNCVSENERQRTSELIKPILRGRDIKRYSYEWAGLWIIGTFPALKLNIDDYPALRNYLESYRPRIDQSGEKGCRKKTSNKWFETQDNIAYYQEFEKEKIVYSEIVREPQFYLDSGEFKFGNFYAEATSFILSGNENFTHSLHYLLGILHSKLITYAFKEFYAGGGLGESGYRYKKAFLERLPIPKVDSKTEAKFIQIVQEIVESKKQGRDTKELESTLDAMVCKLYNLSDDEIRFVESMGGGG
ncbi:type IIG restriction enzyme/methyltransferase [Helicobacter magdeburgensis]|uniref:type IIG restriction enzyme/methyltransferase n=1 Tax=Helicobacter magdeburgensis TaxID=471858 RepID=UPI00051FA504|nr:Eco57I restriction-modification methylase domain-containing protein [Helicobacter magdeburgensis]